MPVAADLIRDYRESNKLYSSVSYWHEGQLRAMIGETQQAINLFNMSRHNEHDIFGWNIYVDASIAFLQKDFEDLNACREKLASLPQPMRFNPVDSNGNKVDIPWPPNIDVVDRLIKYFDADYSEAYREHE